MTPNAKASVRPRRERGAVLIVALILLVILTMLGVTGMNTTSLEERMASNTQELTRAFQAAETGVVQAFGNSGNFSLANEVTVAPGELTSGGQVVGRYQGVTRFEGWSNPPLSSGYSATSFRSAHFQIRITGQGGGQAENVIAAGAYQIAPKP